MQNRFFDKPILNSPYKYPTQYWELDDDGQPTYQILDGRRNAEFITPIPKPKRTKVTARQARLEFDNGSGLSDEDQLYDVSASVNEIRGRVDNWRRLPSPNNWGVTPETARLLQHWRSHQFSSYRPFFCQVEAIETLIWLTEVAPRMGPQGRPILQRLANANKEANPELLRIALKLATGAGKTTVMAMIIAWQTINAVRRPQSVNFTRGFLVVAPGITIRDRLRVLQPNDPDSYYNSRELVPADMLEDLKRAKIVITNYHAFMLRERTQLSKAGRDLLQGRGGPLNTLETEGQMIQRVIPDLMNLKNILVMNDEGHHCYRRKPGDEEEDKPKGDDLQEAKKNNEAARVWISGLETIKRKVGISPRDRPLRHPLLPARLRLPRGHALPLDRKRLLPHGRHRVRHRQAAARPRRRQHPRRRHAYVSFSLGSDRARHAQKGLEQDRRPRPAQLATAVADCAAGSLRSL